MKKNIKIFYVFVLIIFILNVLTLLLLDNYQLNSSNCLNYLSTDINYADLSHYIEKNPLSVRNNQVLVELDIFPNTNSLRCLGVDLNMSHNNLYATATSSTLLNLTSLLTVLVTFYIFIKFENKSFYLFGFLMVMYFFSFGYIFYGEIKIRFDLLIFMFSYFFYLNIKNTFNDEYQKFNLFIFFNMIFLIFNYNIFTKLLPLLILIYFKFFKKVILSKYHTRVLIIIPIFYYFLRQLSGRVGNFDYLWQHLSSEMFRGSPRFADMYYTFAVLNCNKTNCDFQNNYGPLWEYLAIELNPEIYSYIFSVIVILLTQFFYFIFLKNLSNSKQFLVFLIYVSPPSSFLFERMNFDIFVIVIGYFAILFYLKGFKKFSLLTITLLTLVKIFPIVFFFGISVYEFIKKNNRDSVIPLLLIFINSFIYLVYFLLDLQSGFIANPSGVSWTFGVLTDIRIFKELFNVTGYLLYFLTFVISFIIYKKTIFKEEKNYIFYSQDKLIELSFLATFFAIGLYYNFDFRITFFSLGLFFIVKNYNLTNLEFISLLFLATSVSTYFENDLSNTSIFEYLYSILFLLTNQISFNIIMIFLVIEIFNYLKKVDYFTIFKFQNLKNNL